MKLNGGYTKPIAILVLLILISNLMGCIDDESNSDGDNDNQNDIKSSFNLKVDEINNKSLSWLDSLDIDPVKLRYDMGVKGKKKFVELLDTYLVLYQTSDSEENKSLYKTKAWDLIQITFNESYHDMNNINDTHFRQDSTSYLRAWYIMTQFGFDTKYYEIEIDKVIPRIDSHLPSRGINQKMVFVFYYERLGYQIDYTILELFNSSVIRSRKNMEEMDNLDVYFLTHEVFVLHDDNKMWLLTEEDIDFLKLLIPYHVNRTILENNVDLLAELIMIMTQLGFEELVEYETALEYLLASQNPNGSFGDYEAAREYYNSIGIDIEIQLYLHTTEVCLRALNEAVDVFDE
jgi:hypothetical protein